MNTVTLVALCVAALFAAQSWLSIWSRKADRGRHVAMALFILGFPLLAWASLESLSWARPLWAMWGLHGEMTVLAAKMIEGEGIYVYVDSDGEPRSVKLPWDHKQAEQLQELFDTPGNNGKALMRYEWSWDTHPPSFWPMPQPPIQMPKAPEASAAPHVDI